jgi:hypothetical protein
MSRVKRAGRVNGYDLSKNATDLLDLLSLLDEFDYWLAQRDDETGETRAIHSEFLNRFWEFLYPDE